MKIIRLAQALLRTHSWFVATFQALLISFSFVLVWFLASNHSFLHMKLLFVSLVLLIPIRLVLIAQFRLMHGWWIYTGLSDALDISKAVLLGSLAFVAAVHYGLHPRNFPVAAYVLEPILTAGLLIGIRILSRLLAESVRQESAFSKRVILIGAGVAAQTIAREMKRSGSGFNPVGYLDDDVSKQGMRLNGIPVIGGVDDLQEFVEKWRPDEVLIAVPSASGVEMRRFVDICEGASVKFRTVPDLRDIISGTTEISKFREVRVEDILGREPIQIDTELLNKSIAGQTVAVTGAAGSIGSELCRQILGYSPAKLLCLDQNETAMFYLQRELSRHDRCGLTHCEEVIYSVTDIGDKEQVQALFAGHRPSIVFHAAAYKHVPMMELNVRSAVMNNVFGLLTLLSVLQDVGCETFVLISSDKAVNPTSVMGATKRIAELVVASHVERSDIRCVTVRFGNVLFSSGSVVPLLQDQIKNDQPLAITHPEIERFFMTTQEAVSLVLQASAIGCHGETLVLDMGSPIRILDLAHTLLRLAGKLDKIPINIIGLRDGEKLTEELFYDSEEVCATSFPKIKKARTEAVGNCLAEQLENLRRSVRSGSPDEVLDAVRQIVPEYSRYNISSVKEPKGAGEAVAALGA